MAGARRPLTAGDLPVSCRGGRWGRRRVRVGECELTIKAEDCYTALLEQDPARVRPGAYGTLTYRSPSLAIEHEFMFFIEPNGVWRRGRLYLACRSCSRKRTRLYLPTVDSWLACRECWGLTYSSRTLYNYKDSPFGRGALARHLGISQRDWAKMHTGDNRSIRWENSCERWERRRRTRGDGRAG